MSLQERLDEFKKSFESGAPPYNAPHEVIETMHRATAELKATGIEERALKVGDHAPDFTLFNQDQAEIDSTDLLRLGPPGPSVLPRALVTLLQYGTGGSTSSPFRGAESLGARIVVITPELERYTRGLHKKLNPVVRYSYGSSSKGRRAVSARLNIRRTIYETFTNPLEAPSTDSMMNRNTDFPYRRGM